MPTTSLVRVRAKFCASVGGVGGLGECLDERTSTPDKTGKETTPVHGKTRCLDPRRPPLEETTRGLDPQETPRHSAPSETPRPSDPQDTPIRQGTHEASMDPADQVETLRVYEM